MTQHRLWYASLILEAILLCILIVARKCFVFGCWLAFDLLTGAINVWIDKVVWARYQEAWEIQQPISMALRAIAARDVWNRLGGAVWARGCMGMASFICIGRIHHVPESIIDWEFIGIAVGSAALGMITWLSIRAASRMHIDPFVLQHAYVMCAYFMLVALCYYSAWGYRQTIGLATMIVALLAYAAWIVVVARNLIEGRNNEKTGITYSGSVSSRMFRH